MVYPVDWFGGLALEVLVFFVCGVGLRHGEDVRADFLRVCSSGSRTGLLIGM